MPHKFTTLLFDCDNTLAMTEPIAFEACAELTNEILKTYHVKREPYTGPTLMREFVGKNFRGTLVCLQDMYNFKIDDAELERYVDMEVVRVTEKIKISAQECPGAVSQVKWAASHGYKVAVVSSSAGVRVKASVDKIGLGDIFPESLIFSAATSLNPPQSKPHPGVYQLAMKTLGVLPVECVAIEDSGSGAGAALNAKIPTIAYVGAAPESERDELAKKLLNLGAKIRMDHWKDFRAKIQEFERL